MYHNRITSGVGGDLKESPAVYSYFPAKRLTRINTHKKENNVNHIIKFNLTGRRRGTLI